MLEDFRTAPITEAEKALFAFLRKVNRNSWEITAADVAAARRAGWSSEAIYDAINVCGLFNFYNRWIDATGVHEMSAEAHRLSGKRLAQHGYVVTAAAGRGVR
ncbi:MAG TPA: hypothetical protein VEU62_10360 [Bryobacterales bacterium]|nr:hypothetical protein [Bryobacterales bacterium]